MKSQISGIHHITAMASDARQNLNFYTRALGLRFVKKSVNQDDPGTYHLYYGDYTGSPGTILTFFPWSDLPRGRPGLGQSYATAFSVPAGSLRFWQQHLTKLAVKQEATTSRFGDEVLTFFDPDGMRLELVAVTDADPRPATPSTDIPAEYAIRGFFGTTLALLNSGPTAELLTTAMGYKLAQQEPSRTRYQVGAGGPGTYVDLLVDPALPRGLNGAGTIHHVAFRVPDDATQLAAHDLLAKRGLHVSPVIDRAYFKSIYYREPGGILFEIATDQPGFAIDEPVGTLGSRLSLPPRLEPHRAEIEAALPDIN